MLVDTDVAMSSDVGSIPTASTIHIWWSFLYLCDSKHKFAGLAGLCFDLLVAKLCFKTRIDILDIVGVFLALRSIGWVKCIIRD